METLPGTIESVLEVLATRFGTTIEHLWTIMVQQAIAEGVVGLVCLVAVILITYYAIKTIMKREFTKMPYRGTEPVPDRDARDMGYFMVGMMLIVPWMLTFLVAIPALLGLLNPEFWALKQVLRLFGGG